MCTRYVPTAKSGGVSGSVSNKLLLEEFEATASKFRGRITFVFVDGIQFADKMRSVGLTGTFAARLVARSWLLICQFNVVPGGKAALPGLAFNVMDGRVLPFSGEELTELTMTKFCNMFLSGALPALEGVSREC